MTDSMNFGPDWIRNLSSEGSTGSTGGGMGAGGGTRYQLAEYRYGREEMLALFDKNAKPPPSLTNFKSLYSETTLLPLALLSTTEEERGWQGRMTSLSGPPVRGRGGSLERGGRPGRGRGGYQYIRTAPPYEGGGGWGNNGEQTEWSPRKEYNQRTMSMDNWRRSRNLEDDDGWRNLGQGRPGVQEKWVRSTSWRGEGDAEERTGPPERGGRASWNEHMNRGGGVRRSWDNEDHLPEWAMENPGEGGGSFDDKGAFHNSDDELLDGKPPNRREAGLQKSTSQQYISNKNQHPPLSASKSTMSLVKTDELDKKKQGPSRPTNEECSPAKDSSPTTERKKSIPNIPEKIDKDVVFQESAKSEGPPKQKEPEKQPVVPNGPLQENFRNEDSDFEKLQEDFVTKLVVDEDPPKPSNNFDMSSMPVPPNLVPQQIQEKWFYQDPQGQMQGPFTNIEMAEWYKAGYFSHQLKVRRHCDERFFLLGELITMSGGNNPFQTGMRFPILKNDITKMPETDLLQFQYLSQLNAYKQAQARISADPWNALMLQQQENSTQRLIMQQQQVPQDLSYIQQQPAANPLMQMINQMQQANKLPGQGLVDKPTMSGAMDQHIQLQYLSMQNRMPPPTSMTNNLPTGLPTNISGGLQPENLPPSIPNLQSALINPGGITMPGMSNNIPVSIGGNINMSRPTAHSSVDQLNSNREDPISSLLKQLQQKQISEWSQNQFGMVTVPAPPQQWQTQSDVPLAMWDLQQNNVAPVPPSKIQSEPEEVKQQKIEKERAKDDIAVKELKKKKEMEDKQLKKEAEEKRKQEQRKQELEKKAAEEKKKKEEERVKKELEKAKKEAEEKRLRELEEKRRLKDQRKAEEEAKKRADEHRKAEEDRIRHELKEVEAKRQADEKRIQQEQIRVAKAAPWSQSNSTLGMSLAEIQKAEKERRAQETALQVQRLQEKELQQQQQHQQQEKTTGLQFNWAKKPVEPRKVKSLAEIQAEEQEQLAKQAAESRLHKEKEVVLPVTNNTSSIWNSQNINWTNPSPSNHQWSATGGFWDEMSSKNVVHKPSTVTKSNSTNSFNTSSAKPPQQHQTKSKTKKDEVAKINNNNNNNGPSTDEFTNWCYKTLSNISTSVDVPTFVTFLRDIECAFDVREYCKEYLGESNATHQFANNFLEKRRSFKPKNNAHKDDMCSPAPAITPSLQHSTEFQEVKGKNKKNKKSKMLKVDSRILGFNVTSAPDRINVGDRDYGDNS